MRRWSLVATLVAAAVLVLPACSRTSDPDYVSVQLDRLTVDRPAAWTVEFPVEAPWTKGFRPGPDSVEQIQLSSDFGQYTTASQGMGVLIGKAQVGLKGFTVVQSRDVTIKGATTGRVTRYTIQDNKGSQVSGEWIVAAHWPYPQSVAVSILTPQFSPDLERRALDTIRMNPVLR